MNTDGLFSAFNLTEINRMQVGLFRQFFLAHFSRFAVLSDGFSNHLLMWQTFRHAYYASKKPMRMTHCITFYFSLALSADGV